MAQLSGLLLFLWCCLTGVICVEYERSETKLNELTKNTLDTLNSKAVDATYNSAEILNFYETNGTDADYFLRLEVFSSCNGTLAMDCSPTHLVCELEVKDNQSTDSYSVLEDRTKCAEKESQTVLPVLDRGFEVASVTDDVRSAAEFAIQHSEKDGEKRSLIEIMSAKKQEIDNSTILYLTLKVTNTDGGDAMQFETCEAEVNHSTEESILTCFPLSGALPDAITEEDVTTIAENAAHELDAASSSRFVLQLVEVLKAETAVTPGSEGIEATLELRLAPTLCLKDNGEESRRQCPENDASKRITCSLTLWKRPWRNDEMYSKANCNEDESPRVHGLSEFEAESLATTEREVASPDIVGEVEEAFPDTLIEDPVIAKHTYCTGCPVDIDVSIPTLQEFVKPALANIDDGSNSNYMHNIVRIAKAQKQVVNGVKYILYLEVAETSCLKGMGKERELCEPNAESGLKICMLEFVEKPWLDASREIISNNCTQHDNNDLENEIKPHFAHVSNAERQDIFDYLDAMDDSPIEIPYGRDGLYLPDDDVVPDVPPESDAEVAVTPQFTSGEDRNVIKKNSEESVEDTADQKPKPEKLQEVSSESNEDKSSSSLEQHVDKVEAYVTGEDDSREKRELKRGQLVGGLKDIDDSEKELIDKLAKTAVQTLDEVDEDENKRVVLEVLEAKKQLVNGILYHLTLRVGSTSCSEIGPEKPGCKTDQVSPVKICKIQLHQAFTKDRGQEAKVVKSECTLETKRRQRRGIPGGLHPVSVDDAHVKEMAKFALSQMDSFTGQQNAHFITRIIKAERQVVAGTNTYLTMELGESTCGKNESRADCQLKEGSALRNCTVKVFDQPWTSTREVTSVECSDAVTRTKRAVMSGFTAKTDRQQRRGIPGGLHAVSLDDSHVKEMAKFAVTQLDSLSDRQNSQILTRILRAERQVVAGTDTYLTIELGESNCAKSENRSDCQLKEGAALRTCDVRVFDQPWTSTREISSVECSDDATRTKRGLPRVHRSPLGQQRRLVGAPAAVDPSDPSVQEKAAAALDEVEKMSNSMFAQRLVRVLEARTQVVAGTKTYLTMELGYTNCVKGAEQGDTPCTIKEDSNNQICHVEIWDRPWLKERHVEVKSCSPASSVSTTRNKRKVKIGGDYHDIHLGMFHDFMTRFNKSYSDKSEYRRRFHIFRANMVKARHLQEHEQGTAKYGATKFADLTASEFKKHLGLNPKLKIHNHIALPQADIPDVVLPKEFDWRNYNVVTPVKNQGSCGSCWAFSVTGNVEGQWALHRGKLLSLSEQELVDCDKLDEGCNGGLPENAYKAIEKLGGLETETDYPYEAEDEKCHFKKNKVKVTIQGAVNITKNETHMAQWLVKNGPISIGINANAMQFYMGGVSHPLKFLCDKDSLDHGVLIVGYGVHTTRYLHRIQPYWIIKNSWGPDWGEQGYYRVYRGDGTCGVNEMATSAIVI